MNEELKASGGGDEATFATENVQRFSSEDVRKILVRNGWMAKASEKAEASEVSAWLDQAATLLGGHAESESKLEELLRLVIHFEAGEVLAARENQDVIMREGAREVIRELANRVLEGREIDSDGFKVLIEDLKRATPWRSRELFQPIRVALAGRAGDGDLDRVILLLDPAAKIEFVKPVKGVLQRMIEFCAAFE